MEECDIRNDIRILDRKSHRRCTESLIDYCCKTRNMGGLKAMLSVELEFIGFKLGIESMNKLVREYLYNILSPYHSYFFYFLRI